ncbi:MAG: aspartate aminotransferase family protein [Reyranellaceae bacterium]
MSSANLRSETDHARSNVAVESNDYWIELDRRHRLQSRHTHPVCLTRGEGAWLWDVAGNKYLDFESGQICASVGHSNPAYVAAVREQLGKLVQTGSCYIDATQVRFQEKLAGTTGGRFQQSFLACSGSESNEAALRLAKSYTGRSEVVSFIGNYHGHTFGAWSITGFGGSARAAFGPPMQGVTFLPTPFDYATPDQARFAWRDEKVIAACVRFCERMLDATTTGKPAAIVVELLQSAAGVRTLPAAFVAAIRRICDERGALMVVDEAQTGVGRLGSWWGFERFGVVPDVVTASKTLGGGAPLSAMLVSSKLGEEAIRRGYKQSSSHTGDPLLCAAGLATLEIIEREKLLENVRTTGHFLKSELQKLCDASPIGGEMRGEGFLLGLELVRSKQTGEPNGEATQKFTDECRKRGLLTGWWPVAYLASNIVRLMPPYTLTMAEANEALSIVESALKVTGRTGAA